MSERVFIVRGTANRPDPSTTAPKPELCAHDEGQRACYRTLSNGTVHPVMQCLACGGQVRPIQRTETELRTAASGQLFDEEWARICRERRDAAWAAWRASLEDVRALADAAWWDDYDAYLRTPTWQERRRLCLERDEHRCQAKLPGCLGAATQAHHLTYKHLGNEPLFELIGVCAPCHNRITAMDRARRNGA